MHIADLARAENELLASPLEDELRFVHREDVRGAIVPIFSHERAQREASALRRFSNSSLAASVDLGIGRCPTHNSPMNKLYYERADYSVVVKNRAPPPKAWRWEIYRAGNVNPIKQSSVYFDTTAAARRAGKEALKELLNKLFT